MGPVYRAYEPTAGSVAVKVLQDLTDVESKERFRGLAPRLTALRHPNLVSVLEDGEHDGVPFLIVEYVEGGSLADRRRQGRISRQGVLWILRGAAAGVDHAHAGGLVHGDLQPRQVLLGPDDHPFVSDVGLASLSRPGRPADGAPEYLAPEQVGGGEATAAADRYAFATIAYELLVGRTPFEGDADEVLDAQLRTAPPSPSRPNRSLGPATDEVLLRVLAKEPAARWPSCRQMVEALSAALSRDVGRAAGAPGGARRGPWPLLVAVGVLLVAAIAGVAIWLATQQKPIGITLSSSSVRAGDQVTVSANHLPASQLGTVELQSGRAQLAVFQADQYGNVQVQVRVPEDTSPGDHLLSLCWSGTCPAGARLTVTERPPSPTATPTPTPTPSPTPSPTPTPTRSPTQTSSPTPS